MEQLGEYIQANPNIFGLIFIVSGLFLMMGAILKWKWLVGGTVTVRGLIGYLIVKVFGVRVFYIIIGLLLVIIGTAWFFLF